MKISGVTGATLLIFAATSISPGLSFAKMASYQTDYKQGQVPEFLTAPVKTRAITLPKPEVEYQLVSRKKIAAPQPQSSFTLPVTHGEAAQPELVTAATMAKSGSNDTKVIQPQQSSVSFAQAKPEKKKPVRKYVAPEVQQLRNELEADYAGLEKLYQHLHQHPELSNKEEKTAAHLAGVWRELGFDVTEGVGGTGVVGVMKNGEGPTLMLRTDMDALPVKEQTGLAFSSKAKDVNALGAEVDVMHACGHDVHMTAVTGTLQRLVDRKDQWSGTLMVIGQPAEELGKGAKQMLEDGLFEKFPVPDFNLALHDDAAAPAGTVSFTSGPALANVDSVDIHVKGVGGHGAYPHTTKDPVVLSAQIVNALQTLVSREISPLDSAVVTVGSIHAGTKHNIISDQAIMQLTVRSFSDETRAHLINGIARIAKGQAHAFGLPEDLHPVVILKDEYTPVTVNDPALTERVQKAVTKQLGAERVKKKNPVMGGEDFGRYGRTEHKIPGLIFWVGGVPAEKFEKAQKGEEKLPSLHSPFWAPDAEPTLKTAVEAMTAASLELLRKK